MAEGLNGYHSAAATRATLLARIESAFEHMTEALLASGFTLYEISEINLNTRFAISELVKERARRQS